MYLSGLNGCDDVNALLKSGGPFSQSYVASIWSAANLPAPVPLVPSSMVGFYVVRPPRGRPLIARTSNVANAIKAATKGTGGAHPANASEMDFINFFNMATEDPCRKLNPVQKVADAVIKVATVVVPAAGLLQAATDVANAGVAYAGQGATTDLATRVLTPAIEQSQVAEAANAKALEDARQEAFEAQLKALQSEGTQAPALSSSSAAQISYPSTATQPKKYFGLTENELLVAGLALLGAAAIYRSAA